MLRFSQIGLVTALGLLLCSYAEADWRILEQLSPRWPNRGIKHIGKVVSLGVVPWAAVPAAHAVNAIRRLVKENVINPYNTIVVPDARIFRIDGKDNCPLTPITEEAALVYSRRMNQLIGEHRRNSSNRGRVPISPERMGSPAETFSAFVTKFLTTELGAGIAWLEVPRNGKEHLVQLEAKKQLRSFLLAQKFEKNLDNVKDLQHARGVKSDVWGTSPFLSIIKTYGTRYQMLSEKLNLPRHQPVAQKLGGLLTRDMLRRYGLSDLVQDLTRVTILRIYANEGLETLDPFLEKHNIPHEKYLASGDRSSLDYRLYAEFSPPPVGELLPTGVREASPENNGRPIELDSLLKPLRDLRQSSSKLHSRHHAVRRAEIEQLIALDLITGVMNSIWTKIRGPSEKVHEKWKIRLDWARYYMLSCLNDLAGLDLTTLSTLPEYASGEAKALHQMMNEKGSYGMPFERLFQLEELVLGNMLAILIPERAAYPLDHEFWKTVKDAIPHTLVDRLVELLSEKGAELDLRRAEEALWRERQ